MCRNHGGMLPSIRQQNAIFKQDRVREKLGILPIDRNDPEARGDIALAVEIRRTVAWIRYCERQIERLGGDVPEADDALADVLGGLGLVSRETTEGIERDEQTDLTVRKYAAGVGVWEEKLRWNRAHLATLTKQWIAAGFEAKRLELAERTLDSLQAAIDGVVRDLGGNPRDPTIRAMILKRLREAAGRPELQAPSDDVTDD